MRAVVEAWHLGDVGVELLYTMYKLTYVDALCRRASRQIVTIDLPSTSTRGETEQAQHGLYSGWVTSRRRGNQQHALSNRQKEAESRQRQLLTTCMEIKTLCIKGTLKTTSHTTTLEQLRIRADQFRKQGRLQDNNLEEIITEIKASDETMDDETNSKAAITSNNKHRRVMEAVEDGLLQVQGTAPNTKQHGIFCIMGENCNGFNNRIGGNDKIAKALDIKEDLDIDCLM
jgi:hypothetical protein